MRVGYQWCCCVIVVSLVVGCGGNKPPPEANLDLAPVSGVITMNGQPLADANITFLFDGKPPKGFTASGGKSDSSGNFIVMTGSKSGTVPGRYKVVVSLMKNSDGSPVKSATEEGLDANMMAMGGQVVESIPARYSDLANTELSATVPDDGVDDLELKLN